ncbi:uncharacterized protein KQ657_003806 [Scheffersomyces spartinae]|uniref:Uncharacterized protein n=1 Tax=Scheffersomyces spartinae TaxID=45513 RepID=A0A9P7VCN3_9ASCO|nr:uncharacterized protein KQ657_003806 [Scheffersomyces spartinae]KAG7195280.1 hypothetical protein KQ657_003806 [Scheffersomyces spartinae]
MRFHLGRSSEDLSKKGTSSPKDLPPSYDRSVTGTPELSPVTSSTNLSAAAMERGRGKRKDNNNNSNVPFFSSQHDNKSDSLDKLRRALDNSNPSIGTLSPVEHVSSTSPSSNVPYVPSVEEQKHIDKLEGNSLQAMTSHTQTEFFDVLPSFQMFQAIMKRDDNQFNEDLNVNPPVYTNEDTSPRHSIAGLSSHETINQVTHRLREYDIQDMANTLEVDDDFFHPSDGGSNSGSNTTGTPTGAAATTPRREHNASTRTENYGHSVLDTIDRLPVVKYSPLDISIFVTKSIPHPNVTNELETRLKEYTSGDYVNGYIVITNTSDSPVDFGLFTVTLEGTIKATEKNPNTESHLDPHRYSKILMKKFLKMYDLNASYGYVQVPSSAGIEYEYCDVDASDGSILGIPTNRVLQPHTKYKKFFTFKFPNKLLDNVCMHSILPHILPPPSLGFDATSFNNQGEGIELSRALGYGFLSIRGTPLLTKDYSIENVSVSYTIEAKFIDKKIKKDHLKETFQEHDINESNYVIASSSQYFLRFIPDLGELLRYYNQGYMFGKETFGTIGIDGKLFESFLYLSTWRGINGLFFEVEKEIDTILQKAISTDNDIKVKNLRVHDIIGNNDNRENTFLNPQDYDSNIKNRINNELHRNSDEETMYRQERMLGTVIAAPIYKKKGTLFSSSNKQLGQLKVYARIPDKVIPYTSPKLLKKYNNGSIENFSSGSATPTNGLKPMSSHNSIHLTPVTSNGSIRPITLGSEDLRPITSTSSHITDLYNRDEHDLIHTLDIDVLFYSNDNSTRPPPIVGVDVNVVLWTFSSEYPFPVELGHDFFYSDPINGKFHDDDVAITRENMQTIKDKATSFMLFVEANNIEISKTAELNLRAFKTLGIKKDTIQDFFKPLTAASNPKLFSDTWQPAQQLASNQMKWVKSMSIPLHCINKNNVTLIPSYQSCLVGRLYCLQVSVKYKGAETHHSMNTVHVDVPIIVG